MILCLVSLARSTITILSSDSKYNAVDKDWIDVKSNNYFSNEELHKDVGKAAASRVSALPKTTLTKEKVKLIQKKLSLFLHRAPSLAAGAGAGAGRPRRGLSSCDVCAGAARRQAGVEAGVRRGQAGRPPGGEHQRLLLLRYWTPAVVRIYTTILTCEG